MRIAIAGGSLAGLFAAALLSQAGHKVQIFERSRHGLQGRGAGLVPQQELFDLLSLIGREDVARLGIVANQRIILDRAGEIISRDPRPQMQLSWDHLYLAVRGEVDDAAYHLGSGAIAAGQENDGAWLELEDGRRIDADIVIGADGIGSAVRHSLLGDGAHPRYAGYVAWRALVPERLLPEAAALRLSDQFAFYNSADSQALGYTVAGADGELSAGNRRYNAVWYRRVDDLSATLTDREGRAHPFSLPPGGVRREAEQSLLIAAHELLPPPFAAAFTVEPRPFVQAIFDMVTPRMVDGGIAIIGDAAFIARPHTAMGIAKAAGDAMALVSAIRDGWTPAAKARFERERLRAGEAIVNYGRRLGASLSF
ncbi:FAD binding domain-containing protein [Sphingobium yanoikuyae]|uniref:2-polyprenyl-6-methoxyphenol hydroxylase n=1 Tax=Sphingobium yanoikuyae TaxID=13690 RepID=A0A291MY87_SPHYA|nr:NAD(P)-binding protein [Sphingobium yanoikuyae]ATI79961.1 2-polyprenyl-6-methoxyphenol hydroxylase [Sphingobium yanoikuyae]